MNFLKKVTGLGLAGLPFFWAGVLVAAAMAAGVRFSAVDALGATLEPLTQMENPRLIAFGIGREVFTLVNRAELVLAAVAIVSLVVVRPRRWVLAVWGGVLVPLALQTLLWLPELNARADTLLAGGSVEPSGAHGAYVFVELVKLLCLLAAGVLALEEMNKRAGAVKESGIN